MPADAFLAALAGAVGRPGRAGEPALLVSQTEVHALTGYPGWVTALGWGLVTVAVAIVVFVWWWTRAAQPRFADGPLPETARTPGVWDEPLPSAQARYLAHVADVSRRYEAGVVGARAAHLELASAVRGYASARLGRDVRTLTVAEFHRLTGDSPAAAALRAYLGPSFDGPDARPETTRASVAAAWQVIQRW